MITFSTLLHLTQISSISLIALSSKPRHSSKITTLILNFWPPQSFSFLIQIPNTISILILGKKRVLPPLPLPLHLHPMRAALLPCQPWAPRTPSHNPLRNPPIFYPHIHLTNQGKVLPQFQIIDQATLPEMNPHTWQNLLQLNYLQKNLHHFLRLPQKSTLPVDIPQSWLIYPYLSFQQKNLPHLLFLNQISALLVYIPQAYHIWSHLKSQFWSLSQLHYIHQVTLTVEITPHSHQNKHKSNSLTFYPQNNSPQIYHHQSLLLYPVPFQVLIPVQFQVLVPKIQDPISCHPLFHTQYFPPTNYHQCHLQNNYMNTQVITPSHNQDWFQPQLILHLFRTLHIILPRNILHNS